MTQTMTKAPVSPPASPVTETRPEAPRAPLTPPIAEKRQHAVTQHGMTRQDPYHWLRADNWQEVMQAPETLPADIRAISRGRERLFRRSLRGAAGGADRDASTARSAAASKKTTAASRRPTAPFAYNSRMLEGKQYPLEVRTPRDGGAETVLLDCNAEAGENYFGFGGGEHSPDHRLLAWAADRQGSEYYTIHIRDLATGKDTGEVITEAADGGVWSADSRCIYYTEFDESHRPFRVRRHRLGTQQAEDEIIFEEADPGFFVGVGETLSRKYITSSTPTTTRRRKCWLIDASDPAAQPRLVSARLTEREYDIEERDGVLYILHQCRRGRGLQDRHRAGRRAGRRELGRPRAASRRAC